MEDIKIYHSLTEQLLYFIGCLVFVVLGLLLKGENGFIAWTAIIFFGSLGLSLIYKLIKNLWKRTPYITIKDDCFVLHSNQERVIMYSDIESLKLEKSWLGINYNEEAYKRFLENQSNLGFVDSINRDILGTHDYINLAALILSPEEIFNILRSKLEQQEQI